MTVPTINLGDLGKPADTLIKKISNAIEGIYKPTQIKRLAKAQAEADMIKAKSDIKIHELQQRALQRFVAEETKKQDNMEKITEKALPLLDKASDPKKMDDDWITNFFDKCRLISDEEMQVLWAKILAGEANSPGSFSKRTVNLLNSINKIDANLFNKLCGFTWKLKMLSPLIFNFKDEIYTSQGIREGVLIHLEQIGLISCAPVTGYVHRGMPKINIINYFNMPLIIELKKEIDNELDIGKVIFTNSGSELAKICGAQPVNGFFEYAIETWRKKGLIVSIKENTNEKK